MDHRPPCDCLPAEPRPPQLFGGKNMKRVFCVVFLAGFTAAAAALAEPEKPKLYLDPIDVERAARSRRTRSVKYDYDIVYVRAQRAGDKVHKRFYTDFSQPVTLEPGADLMLLHPDGTRGTAGRRRRRLRHRSDGLLRRPVGLLHRTSTI